METTSVGYEPDDSGRERERLPAYPRFTRALTLVPEILLSVAAFRKLKCETADLNPKRMPKDWM
jgi:hypothetical protein